MEVGLSPRAVDRIIMVVRSFPIRVGGTSGPFKDETTWEEIRAISGAPEVIREYTSVTHRLRRVARFDLDAVRMACRYNCPTGLAVMGLDRIDYANTGITEPTLLTPLAWQFLEDVELGTGVPVEFAGTGFGTFDAVHIIGKSRKLESSHV
jgi:adenylosuccinate synthase